MSRSTLASGVWVEVRAEPLKGVQVVNPQANRQRLFGRQLASQAPANADVAIVIDDVAENIPNRWADGMHHNDSRRANGANGANGA